MGVLIGAALVVVVIVFVVASGFGSDANDGDANDGGGATQPPRSERRDSDRNPRPSSTRRELESQPAREGRTPDRPAPSIARSDLDLAEQHYQAAKQLWNDSERARSQGRMQDRVAMLSEAFDEMKKLYDALRPYTNWFEEADMGEWAMPGEYVSLQRRLGIYDKMHQKIKKVMQMR